MFFVLPKQGVMKETYCIIRHTEGGTITEVPVAHKSDRDVTYGVSFIFWINAIHHSHRKKL